MTNHTASDQGFSMPDLGSAFPGLTATDRAGLVSVLKDKLQTLARQQSSMLDALTPTVKKRVTVLQEIQAQHDELEKKFFEERAELEACYQKLYEPLYTKRYEIVNGITEVEGAAEEATEIDASAKGNKSGGCLQSAITQMKGVPEFWLSAMKMNERLAIQITKRDEEALKHLKDIKWSKLDNPKGFKLEFFFDANPYFKNTVLTKAYHMVEEDEPILERAIGTEIEWHAGKNLTQKVMRRKVKKSAKDTKPITKMEVCESFFNFFSPPQVPEDDEVIDQDTVEELQDMMEQDYEIGSTIRDKIIPHAVSWYTGEAVKGDEFEDAEEAESRDLDEDEDEDEDDEDEGEDAEQDDDGRKGQKVV